MSIPATPTTPANLDSIDPALTLLLAGASMAAYNAFNTGTFTTPANYSFLASFQGWDGIIGSLGRAENYGLIFQSTLPGTSQLLIAFRGTSSRLDIFEDAFFDKNTFAPYANAQNLPGPVRVEAGFYDVYAHGGTMPKSMQQTLFEVLEQINPAELLVTGHSLGAALSQLFSLDVAVSRPDIKVTNLNFSSPRVGDASWGQACATLGVSATVTRVVNYYDSVPHYPLQDLGYVAVGDQFQTAFCAYHALEDNPLSNHSLANLQTVLTHALPLTPPEWVGGTFVDAELGIWMQSLAVPGLDRAQWLAQLQALHAQAQATPRPALPAYVRRHGAGKVVLQPAAK
ncbi:lipase family protein [Hymenobacter aquaticus]|uniref:Lipase family protein n=1 Tax=Hymenobacter aquaticus TaxID=1867101 RepID=A0A4Z0Q610_9BACT|nr:lipase family protein [Hymenobacter aquaticus]TGE25074.1 lipase family protein [Hymenobacter aquaticus]